MRDFTMRDRKEGGMHHTAHVKTIANDNRETDLNIKRRWSTYVDDFEMPLSKLLC